MNQLSILFAAGAVAAGLLGGARGAEANPRYAVTPPNPAVKFEGGAAVNTGLRPATLELDAPLAPGQRLTLPVKLPAGAALTIHTGRGGEHLAIVNRREYIYWDHRAPNGTTTKKTEPWDTANYYPNGQIRESFSYTPAMLDWNNYFSNRRRDISKEFFPVTLTVQDGKCRWYLDHILLQEHEATGDIAGNKLRITLPPGGALETTQISEIPDHGRFLPVDIGGRYNAANPAPGHCETNGIPFETAPPDTAGNNSIDIGRSWVREASISGNEMSHRGSFGGRWSGALGGTPTRIQFRIPYGQYTAIYLLASCPKREDRVPRVTAQFFRTGSGFPKSFTAEAADCGNGLQVIKIPVKPGELQEFSDRSVIEVELTGDVHVYRGYPDPLHYSTHGGGIPSGIQVYAMTLETAPVEVSFEPEEFGNVWAEPAKPSYRVELNNPSPNSREVELKLTTESFDKAEKKFFSRTVNVPAGQKIVTRFDLPLEKFGWHRVTLNADGQEFERSLALLRRREYKARPFDAKGFMFGYWNWRGSHLTPSNLDTIRLLGKLGMESASHNGSTLTGHEVEGEVRRYGMKNFWAYERGPRTNTPIAEIPEFIRKSRLGGNAVTEPVYVNIFAEPGGIGTEGNLPEFYGEAEKPMTPEQQQRFEHFKQMAKVASAEIRKLTPNVKIMMPWGDPVFAVPFLKDPETRNLFDGIAFDAGYFDRLPEQQLHQCSLHRMHQFMTYWKKYRQGKPFMITVEGPCLAQVTPGGLTEEQFAAHMVRAAMILAAYGIDRQFSLTGAADCASYWGEQHYGGGFFSRINGLNPHVAYAAAGTMIRHLRHMEFVKWVPTGSLSTYCLQFRDSRDGKIMHVLWTVRGKRPLKVAGPFRAYDSMDNLSAKPVISQMPIYVYADEKNLAFGEPDHSDQTLAKDHILLGNSADVFTRQNQDTDDEYLNSFPEAVRRFPAAMKLDKTAGGLAVTLPPQEIDRGTMPYYTTLHPDKPVFIPGKAKYLTMETTAASDWGRIVYVLRDAKGEKWISVGTKGTWNNDDTPNASVFNFDGKRLIRFELPSNLPWDHFREMGTTWWGASGGDQVVDLPLSLEKIFIERRGKAMYVNSLETTDPAPVVLGKLYAEYESPETMKPQPDVNMPAPPVTAKAFNPIHELAETATLPPTEITGVEQPDHYYDGTRGVFRFREMPGAAYYDIYLSQSPDGTNALKLGSRLRNSGVQVNGFLPDTDFYAFAVWYDRQGKHSKPSAGFKFKLQDNFGNK